jgi:hypothetical protein
MIEGSSPEPSTTPTAESVTPDAEPRSPSTLLLARAQAEASAAQQDEQESGEGSAKEEGGGESTAFTLRRNTYEQRKEVIRRFAQSGLSMRAFCRQEELRRQKLSE